MFEQIRKLKEWFNEKIETEMLKTHYFFPKKNKAGKVILAIGIIFLCLFVLTALVAPVEEIPYDVIESYQKKEPFKTLISWFILLASVGCIAGMVLWASSWGYIKEEKKTKKDLTED